MDAERLPAPVGPGSVSAEARVLGVVGGQRGRFWARQGGLSRRPEGLGGGMDYDGPSDDEEDEMFGWLLGEGLAPPPAARAWGTEMVCVVWLCVSAHALPPSPVLPSRPLSHICTQACTPGSMHVRGWISPFHPPPESCRLQTCQPKRGMRA